MPLDFDILGLGVYTPREAARLIGSNAQNVLRWTRGSGPNQPLWNGYYSDLDDSREISFADLTELRVVVAFRNQGISMQAIRFAIQFAQERFDLKHALSSANFKTDGKSILLDAVEEDGSFVSLSSKNAGQKVFKEIIAQSLVDLEYEGMRPVRWRPKNNKHIVIDPKRFFGDPILEKYGVSTSVIAKEYSVYNDLKYISAIYDIPKDFIKNAINFEESLDGQSSV